MPFIPLPGADGVFNEGDYLLFYGKGTNRWIFDSETGEFSHVRHNYSDTAFYFITSGPTQGKRIGPSDESLMQPNYFSTSSDALHVHEVESDNILHSGREWYQPVSSSKDTEVNPGFRDLVPAEKIKYSVKVLARASVPTSFRISENGSVLTTVPVPGINLSSTTGTYAQAIQVKGEAVPASPAPVYKISFLNGGEISAKGWIDYLTLHARKQNKFTGSFEQYTDSGSAGSGNVTEFTIKSSVAETQIWDVTDPFNPETIRYDRSGENITFRRSTGTLRTFIAFLPGNALPPVINAALLANQDLHSSAPADMIIVTNPQFRRYAERLAGVHQANSSLVSLVTTPGQIYNEFSGGIPDIVAIRNFLRMKYTRSERDRSSAQVPAIIRRRVV